MFGASVGQATLIDRVCRAEISFSLFVEILSTRGCITEKVQEEGCGFGSTAMEAVRQDHFDALFAVLFPGVLNEISLSCVATDEGGIPHVFSYAIFNANVIGREDILKILVEENRAAGQWLESNSSHVA